VRRLILYHRGLPPVVVYHFENTKEIVIRVHLRTLHTVQLIEGTGDDAMTTCPANAPTLTASPARRQRYVTPTEAGDILGVHIVTLRRWAWAGKLPHYVTPGGKYRYDLDTYHARVMRPKGSGVSALSDVGATFAEKSATSRPQSAQVARRPSRFTSAVGPRRRELPADERP
jgi:excisionase family DNA binding protein